MVGIQKTPNISNVDEGRRASEDEDPGLSRYDTHSFCTSDPIPGNIRNVASHVEAVSSRHIELEGALSGKEGDFGSRRGVVVDRAVDIHLKYLSNTANGSKNLTDQHVGG
jgi:hypothetical protein